MAITALPVTDDAPALDPLKDLGRLVIITRNQLTAKLDDVLAPLDLTTAQYGVVIVLSRGQWDAPAQLCQLMDYDRGAMTRLLDRMVSKGLIVRLPNEKDRRCVTLKLTEKSLALLPKLEATVSAVYQTALSDFSEAEAALLAGFLNRMIGNLG
ncbi:MarR family winged helix-turn-helix transcriptional regulator [Gallaecimonas mangrovi]|uniref:MarR family winged helix-turn-helix transcriptional regulator n=1 Tax=Gallaecimonas mangrovi TaxID=2291597 RepID=UPI0018683BCC|nr:MarR family transcriptional regulator [Gallaecimonas mangrovi]